MKKLKAAVLVLGLIVASVAQATPSSPAQARTVASVTLPFAPVLNKPLRLRQERRVTKLRGGVETEQEEMTTEEEVVFTGRNAQGYVMRWTTKSVTVRTSPEKQAMMERVMAVAVGKHMLIQADAEGAPTAVLNLADMRALFVSSFDAMIAAADDQFAAKPAAERAFMRKTFAGLADMYRSMTDEQLSEMVLEEVMMLFGFGGLTLTSGEPLPFKGSVTVPVVNSPIAVEGKIELRTSGPDGVTLAVSSASNPADVKAATAAYLEKALVSLEPAQRSAMAADIRNVENFTMTDELVVTLDAADGIVRRADYRKRVGVAEQIGLETKSYTRLN
jgi:hypothetical protein